MARENRPSWLLDLISDKDGLRVYIYSALSKSLKANRIVIDVLDFADDSFSLEINHGKRFTMSTVSERTVESISSSTTL